MSTEDQLTLFAGDSLVSHSVSPGSNSAQKMTEHSGRKCCESYAKWLPDGSLARMFLESSRWNSTMCYLTWKGKATPAGRLYFQLVPSTPTIAETESGLWRTPAAMSGGTPKALLEGQTTRPSGHKIQIRLQDQVRMWPTPQARDWRAGSHPESGRMKRKTRQGWGSNLNDEVLKWPTPQDSDNKNRGHLGMPSVKRRKEKGKQLNLSMVASHVSGSLNPTWVEWLMGFPIGHTDLKPSGTP